MYEQSFSELTKYFNFSSARLYKDFPSLKDFLTVKCCVRILMTGQIGWSPDGLRMNNGTKEIKTRERKSQNSLVTLVNVLQTRLTIPPSPHLCWSRWPHTTHHTPPPDTTQCHSCQTRPRAKFCRRENRSIIAGWLNVALARAEVGTEMMMMMIQIIYIQ